MFKRIAQWLAGIFRTELLAVRGDISGLQAAVVQLRGELAEATAALHSRAEEAKTHAESVASELHENVTNHAVEVAKDLHDKIAADAKAIAHFRQMVRMSCSWCGQLSWDYIVNRDSKKIICSDCQKKGRK